MFIRILQMLLQKGIAAWNGRTAEKIVIADVIDLFQLLFI
ncbi:MAG: hypothetical protein ACJAT7_000364 [Psychromonas sp.]